MTPALETLSEAELEVARTAIGDLAAAAELQAALAERNRSRRALWGSTLDAFGPPAKVRPRGTAKRRAKSKSSKRARRRNR